MSTLSNDNSLGTAPSGATRPSMSPAYRWALGLVLTGLFGGLAYLAFRAYLTPEMLVGLANYLYLCH